MEAALIKTASKEGRATRKAEGSRQARNARRKIKMSQADNDLQQLKQCRKDLAGIYKSQVHDNISDNGNLAILHNSILNVGSAIKWLEAHLPKE